MKIVAVSHFRRPGLREVIEKSFPAGVSCVAYDDLSGDYRPKFLDEIGEADLLVMDLRSDDRDTAWVAGVAYALHCPVLVFGDPFVARIHPVDSGSIGAFYRVGELEEALRRVAEALAKGPEEFASLSTEFKLRTVGQG